MDGPIDAKANSRRSSLDESGEFPIEHGHRNHGSSGRRPQIRRRATVIAASAAAVGLLLYGSLAQFQPRPLAADKRKASEVAAFERRAVINLPPPNLLKPLTPDEAAKENAERPFVSRPDTPAARFVLKTDADDRERALNCLAQAVYYEAAGEGVDGERAVAQVVLNRMRHPGYPASVCGVIYQGADRPSGCQFTFACDGSLLREPVASLWTRSRKIAEEALAGRVFAAVGHATHYHADYVLPYWADSLDKTVQIGRHIFYRLRSSLGDSRAFFQHYAGSEPLPPKPETAVVIPPADVTDQLASALISDGVTASAQEVEKAAPPATPPPLIDSLHGTLIGDDRVTTEVQRPKERSECPPSSDGKQLRPLGPNDIRAGDSHNGC
jgi:spore germination cell wall hydrolase CwlJ-like protein